MVDERDSGRADELVRQHSNAEPRPQNEQIPPALVELLNRLPDFLSGLHARQLEEMAKRAELNEPSAKREHQLTLHRMWHVVVFAYVPFVAAVFLGLSLVALGRTDDGIKLLAATVTLAGAVGLGKALSSRPASHTDED